MYGSSHVGILGGIIAPTNDDQILQLDLLKTDYYHAPAYPTFLYYNPHAEPKAVMIDFGREGKDLYDAVTHRFLKKNVRGKTSLTLSADAAMVVVVAPARTKMTRTGQKTLLDGIVVDYNSGSTGQ